MNDIESSPYSKSDSKTRSSEERWQLLGSRVPKAEIVYFSQILIEYVIIITSITNLSLQNGSMELWISLLSSCIGYALPNPKLKKMKCTLPFEPCSSICISGQTGSGKTRWVYRFLTHIRDMYGRDPPSQILYCYGIYQPLFDKMERTIMNFRSKQGLPSSEELEEFTMDGRHKLIVIDNLMHRVVEDKEME